MRGSRRSFYLFAGIVLGVAAVDIPAVKAQVVAIADRGPRFLRSAPTGLVPVDVKRTPVLRRRIALTLRDVPLGEALDVIARASGLRLGYSRSLVPVARTVRLIATDITVAGALSTILFDTGLDVVFSGDQAALVSRNPGVPAGAFGAIVGRVVDSATGRGLPGAEVFLDGTQWHASTDTTGWYHLAEVDSGTYTLTARRLGYAKRSRRVTVWVEQTDTVNLVLAPVAAWLQELVTTATGQQRRRDIGNAITTIHADSVLQNAPIRNLTDLLENRVPGLTVQHTSGAPGDPAKLRLRGIGSVLQSNDPVVIVDGVRVYAAESEARSGNLTNLAPSNAPASQRSQLLLTPANVPAPSPLDQIDPNIIETIEVFKGPSAATLYGADAANGVIVVTTKKGRPGPTRWTASVTQARTTSAGQYPSGYYRWGYDVRDSLATFCTLLDRYCVQDSLVQFQALNVPVLTLLGSGGRTALSLTASGGTQTLLYSVTGSYDAETGPLTLPGYEVERFRTSFNQDPPDWMRRPHHLRTWQVTSNVTARVNPAMDVTLSTGLSRSEQSRTSLESQFAALAGTYIDTVNGFYYRPSTTTSGTYILNTTTNALQDYYTQQTASALTFTSSLNTQWRPRPWFTASGQAGLNVIARDDRMLLPSGLIADADSSGGAAIQGIGRSLVSTFNVQGVFRKPVGWGFVFTTSVGANLTTTSTNDLIGSAAGLVRGTSSIVGAERLNATEQGSNTSVYGWYIEPRFSGQRISLSTGLRLDGGSAYGVRVTGGAGGGLLHNLLSLPKLNGSWVISEEPWFPFNALFSSLRLRGAYGQAQVQPGAADRLRLYAGTSDPGASLLLTTLGNTQLRPERSTEFEGGFDADLLDSRVSLEVTAYRKLRVDALMNLTLPISVNGGGSVLMNVGNIRNTGVELTLGVTPVRYSAVTWSAQLNYSQNRNILTKLGAGVPANKTQGLVEGYPVGGRWARPILGFADQDGDGVLQPYEIRVSDSSIYVGLLQPAYTTALHTNLVLFGGTVGIAASFSYDAGQVQVDQTARTNWVLSRAFVDPSTPLSEQAAVVASTQGRSPTDYGLMQEVSTLRFSSLSVNYRMPGPVTRLFRAQQMAVAVQGANLGLHSTYHGKDPDVNSWSPGEDIVDTGQIPQPRTWQLRVNLQY